MRFQTLFLAVLATSTSSALVLERQTTCGVSSSSVTTGTCDTNDPQICNINGNQDTCRADIYGNGGGVSDPPFVNNSRRWEANQML